MKNRYQIMLALALFPMVACQGSWFKQAWRRLFAPDSHQSYDGCLQGIIFEGELAFPASQAYCGKFLKFQSDRQGKRHILSIGLTGQKAHVRVDVDCRNMANQQNIHVSCLDGVEGNISFWSKEKAGFAKATLYYSDGPEVVPSDISPQHAAIVKLIRLNLGLYQSMPWPLS